jgi:hypothetical protein
MTLKCCSDKAPLVEVHMDTVMKQAPYVPNILYINYTGEIQYVRHYGQLLWGFWKGNRANLGNEESTVYREHVTAPGVLLTNKDRH